MIETLKIKLSLVHEELESIFKIAASIDLNTSTYLFTELGGTSTLEGKSVRHIDTMLKVTGMKTGYTLSIPVRYVKSIIS